jgi:hypothetical protein
MVKFYYKISIFNELYVKNINSKMYDSLLDTYNDAILYFLENYKNNTIFNNRVNQQLVNIKNNKLMFLYKNYNVKNNNDLEQNVKKTIKSLLYIYKNNIIKILNLFALNNFNEYNIMNIGVEKQLLLKLSINISKYD